MQMFLFLFATPYLFHIIGAHPQLSTFPADPATPNVTRTSAVGSSASTSLYIPGFDPQPVSADVVGVDGNGQTTWVLHRGSVDATDTRSYDAFWGTATLIEGAKDASLTYANADAEFTIGVQCAFSESTLAVCTIEVQGSTATQTEVITHQPIQGGGTLMVIGTASISVPTSISGTSTPSITDPSTSFPTTGVAITQAAASPTSSSSSGSSGPKRGSTILWAVGLALPYLVFGPRFF